MIHTPKIIVAALLLLAPSVHAESTRAALTAPATEKANSDARRQDACDDNCSKLKLHTLCANNITARCVQVNDRLAADDASIIKLDADTACVQNLRVNNDFCADAIRSANVCSNYITTTTLCANGIVYAQRFEACDAFRLTAVVPTDTFYKLGDPVPFSMVLDDPNGDFTPTPTAEYVAPRKGYYIVTTQVDVRDLTGPSLILGTPVASISFIINGQNRREVYVPFLSFLNMQKANLSGIVTMNAGDRLHVTYRLFTFDQANGFQAYPGTATVEGATDLTSSLLKIHFLSGDCDNNPCQPCNTTCSATDCASSSPCPIPCTPSLSKPRPGSTR